jgi:filamentous hemagglutinin family protein
MAKYTKRWAWQFGLVSTLAMGGVAAFSGNCAFAQITPDGTLGTERSIVKPNVKINGSPADRIDGGAARGANLLHSFREFNVGDGQRVYFANPVGIENILSRVTGTDPSDILGTLGVDGGANLFLLNPNGIIFGPNATLDVGGSFVASTANAIQFGERGFFSASTPEAPSLLTVNPSAFLFNQITAKSITNQSVAGLQVPESQSLLLLGGDVSLDGGVLLAPGGRVELGGLAEVGTVGVNEDGNSLRLSFPNDIVRADVSLTNRADVNARAGGGGSIAINAQNLNIAGASRVRTGIASGLGSLDSKAGDIEINATGAINLTNGSFVSNAVFDGAVGKGGDLNIMAGSLSLTNGARLIADTFGQGDGGNVNINARDIVFLYGQGVDGLSSQARAITFSLSRGGDVTIETGKLVVQDGAQVGAVTTGPGQGGNLTVTASDSVELKGFGANSVVSGLFAQTQGAGDAGNLRVETGKLIAQDGAQVGAGTRGVGKAGNLTVIAKEAVELTGSSADNQFRSGLFGSSVPGAGDAGDLTVETGRLIVQDGARVITSSFGVAKAGNLTVSAKEAVEIKGTGISADGSSRTPSGLFTRSFGTGNAGNLRISTGRLIVQDGARASASTNNGKGGSLTVTAKAIEVTGIAANGEFGSGLFAQTVGTGDAGDLTIETGQLTVREQAEVTVSSEGSGKAGDLTVAAGSIRLDNQGAFRADTTAGGGNIILRSQDLILRRGSNITTNATGSEITGGNITLNTDVLAALENSDISANSDDFFGGQVIVNAQGVFGTEFRPNPTPESDITATGGSPELSGTVQINTPDVDPSQGLANLPSEPVNTEIAQDCQADGGKASSSFINTGSGGLPTNPYEPLSSDEILADVQPPTQWKSNPAGSARASTSPKTTPDRIVEAQGWSINKTGEVVLAAKVPPAPSQRGCRLR